MPNGLQKRRNRQVKLAVPRKELFGSQASQAPPNHVEYHCKRIESHYMYVSKHNTEWRTFMVNWALEPTAPEEVKAIVKNLELQKTCKVCGLTYFNSTRYFASYTKNGQHFTSNECHTCKNGRRAKEKIHE